MPEIYKFRNVLCYFRRKSHLLIPGFRREKAENLYKFCQWKRSQIDAAFLFLPFLNVAVLVT